MRLASGIATSAVAVAIALSIGGPRAAFAHCRASAADLVTEARPLRGFHRIGVGGPIDLVIKQGARESVTVRADRKLMPHVKSAVKDGRLVLDLDRDPSRPERHLCPGDLVVEITVVQLSALDVWGPSRVEVGKLGGKRLALDLSGPTDVVADQIAFDELELSMSGPASVRFGGQVARQRIDISGPAEYAGERLASRSARVEMSGPGDARVLASDDLDVEISGVGTVGYLGNPRVTRRVSGLGSLRRLRR